jgi:hypothetical protein
MPAVAQDRGFNKIEDLCLAARRRRAAKHKRPDFI